MNVTFVPLDASDCNVEFWHWMWWGNAPEWAAAIGAGVAVFVALRAYRKQAEANRLQADANDQEKKRALQEADARLREQARQIVFAITLIPGSRDPHDYASSEDQVFVRVANESMEPIRDIRIEITDAPSQPDPVVVEIPRLASRAPNERVVPISLVGAGTAPLDWLATFTDAEGNQWEHDSSTGLRRL